MIRPTIAGAETWSHTAHGDRSDLAIQRFASDPRVRVVEPVQVEHLATHDGGSLVDRPAWPAAHHDHPGTERNPRERATRERSFHVATQNYDQELILAESVAFANWLTACCRQ